ncbi:MAG: DUF4113 domain-containing protein [Pyrinomonadaceae bacterium]|nr:DUF4113 domain-containing protein [Pyrinomonadaceae bacterium]
MYRPLTAKCCRTTTTTLNTINGRHGSHTIRPLAMGSKHPWEMRQERLSRQYTTR